jgi:hypothetical protein
LDLVKICLCRISASHKNNIPASDYRHSASDFSEPSLNVVTGDRITNVFAYREPKPSDTMIVLHHSERHKATAKPSSPLLHKLELYRLPQALLWMHM